MKIVQSIMSDLLYNKTDSVSSAQSGLPLSNAAATAPVTDNAEVTAMQSELIAQDVESETLEALTQDKKLTPEQKKQVEELMKDPHMTQKEKIQAITLMLRKSMPLTREVMHTINEGLAEPLLNQTMGEALNKVPSGVELLPTLLKSLVAELLQSKDQGAVGAVVSEQTMAEFFANFEDTLFLDKGQKAMDLEPLLQIFEDADKEHTVAEKPLFIGKELPAKETKGNDVIKKDVEPLSELSSEEALETTLTQLIYAMINQGVDQPADVSASDGSKGKIFLRQEVKVAMQSAKVDFDQFKQTTMKQLKAMDTPAPAPNQQQMIQKTIEAVDKVLMKSDIPLYTSMKMEKQLLVLSSDLQTVKTLASQGKWDEAKQGLKEVISVLENMQFKPSAKKMIYQSGFINAPNQIMLSTIQNKGLDLMGTLGKQITAFSELKGSPRMVLEHLRGLGYNQAAEQQQHGKSSSHQQFLSKQRSIYQVLEALSEDSASKDAKDKDKDWPKMLTESIGAHRLVNKLEEGSMKQSMDLTIPYRLHEEVAEVKVHIDARKQDELLDWENFQMFFVMETKNMGQVGIGVHTVDRKLSLTFKAENRRTVNKLTPLADELKKSLVGVGYQLVGIQYGLLTESQNKTGSLPDSQNEKIADVHTDGKGVDIKV